MHQAIQKVTDDIEERFHFNTAIATVMELVNAFYQTLETLPEEELTFRVWREGLETMVKLFLTPWCPIWPKSSGRPWVMKTPCSCSPGPRPSRRPWWSRSSPWWCRWTARCAAESTAPVSASEEQLKQLALQDPSVQKWLKGEPRRVVLARGKLINIVT